MDKKTVVIFTAFYAPWESGAERFAREVVENLKDRYHFVLITTRNSKNAPKLENARGYQIRRLGWGTRADKWLFPLLAPMAATRLKPNLVHAVMESYAGIALALFKLFNWKIPIILTLQSGDLDDRKKQKKIPYLLWKIIHLVPTHLTAISRYLGSRAERLGVSKERISIIPNGVNLEELRPLLERDELRIPFRLVCVGRLSWEKGQEYLISAMPLIRKEFPDAHIVLVGGGADEGKLRKLTHSLDLDSSVFFRGMLPHSRAMGEVANAEVFVVPSLAEGLGIVFLESQALGVPVIGTYVGGIPDVIENEVTGLLVAPKDSVAIADAVGKMFRDQALRDRLVNKAKERISQFSWDKIAASVASLYDRYL